MWTGMMKKYAVSDKLKGRIPDAGFDVYQKCNEQRTGLSDRVGNDEN